MTETQTENDDAEATEAVVVTEEPKPTKAEVEQIIDEEFHSWFQMANPEVCQSTVGTGIDVFAPAANAQSNYRLLMGLVPIKKFAAVGVDGYIVSSLSIRGLHNGNQIRVTCDDHEPIDQASDEHRGKWWTVGLLTLKTIEDAKKAAACLMKNEFGAVRLSDLEQMPGAEECREQYTAFKTATARIGGRNPFNKKGPILYDPKRMVLMWEPSGAPLSETTCWHNKNVGREREMLARAPKGLTAAELGGAIGQA